MALVNNNIDRIFLGIMATLLWAAFPILSIFVLFYLIYKVRPECTPLKYFSFLIALTFGLIAYTAVSVGQEPTDLVRYTNQYRMFVETDSFGEFLITSFLGDGGFYLVFQSLTFLLAKTFPENPQVLPLLWVTVAYYFLILAVLELSQYKKVFSKSTFLLLLIALLFGTTFYTLEVELLKQSASMAIASYAIFRRLNKKKYNGWIYLVAMLIHSSVFIFLPVFFLFGKRLMLRYHLLFLGAAIVFSFFDLNKLAGLILGGSIGEKAQFYARVSNWTVTKINYFMFITYGLLIGLAFVVRKRTFGEDQYQRHVFVANLLFFCLLLVQFSSMHNFVRYNYLYSPFYLLSFFFILTSRLKHAEKTVFTLAYMMIMISTNFLYTITYLSSSYTNAYMGNSFIRLLSANIYTFLSYKAVN